MKCIVLILMLFTTRIGFSQSINWQKATHWKLYDMRGKNGLRYLVDTLSHFNSVNLNDDSLHYFLQGVELWPPEKYSMWMGQFVVSCEDEKGNLRKLDISMYGGFFFDDSSKRYYQIREEVSRDWMDYFNNNSDQFQSH